PPAWFCVAFHFYHGFVRPGLHPHAAFISSVGRILRAQWICFWLFKMLPRLFMQRLFGGQHLGSDFSKPNPYTFTLTKSLDYDSIPILDIGIGYFILSHGGITFNNFQN